MSETEKTVEERIAQLEQQIAAVLEKLKTAQEEQTDEHGCIIGKEKWDGTKCVPVTSPEVASLQQKVAALETEKHAIKVKAAVDARYEAELVTDKAKDTERLTQLDTAALTALTEDAIVVATKMKANKKMAPKYQYAPSEEDTTKHEAAVKDMRKQLFSGRLLASVKTESEQA